MGLEASLFCNGTIAIGLEIPLLSYLCNLIDLLRYCTVLEACVLRAAADDDGLPPGCVSDG